MSAQASSREPVEKLAEEFAERFRRGERPSLTEYVQRYPELAEQIRELFPALVVMEQFGSVAEAAAGPLDRSRVASGKIPEQLGEYHILREVGRGGMGVVYEAVQESLGRHVALKVLPYYALLNPTHLERFRREARAAAQLHHTNIVPVFGIGEHEGIHYYAMQFIQGQGLDDVLKEVRRLRDRREALAAGSSEPRQELTITIAEGLVTGQFAGLNAKAATVDFSVSPVPTPPVGEGRSEGALLSSPSLTLSPHSEMAAQSQKQYFRSVARLGVQVAEAMAYAHKQGVLHRDIKPSNLLLDTQGTVWITDFGLAKSEGSDELTMPGDIIGTLRYMAPERFQGKADSRSDVYSLGMALYELLTLRPAFEDANRARLMDRVTHEEPPRPRKLDAHIPRDLETVVLKAIAKEPAHRYQTADVMAEDLRRFLADRPIKARRSSLVERTWRWCRRNPGLAGALGLVAASLIAVAIVSTVSAVWLKGKGDQLAEAERKARLREADALVGQAHGTRLSRRPGQRFAALEALGKAASIGRQLEQPPEWFDRLRNEAIAALALTDIYVTQEWTDDSPDKTWIELSDDFELYVRATDKGVCTVHRVADGAEVARLPDLGEPAQAVFGSGRVLGLRAASGRFQLWDLSAAEPVLRFEESSIGGIGGWSFRHDGRLLALFHADGSLSVRDTATGERVYQLAPGKIIAGEPVLHPTEPFVATFSYFSREVEVRDLRTGAVVTAPPLPWPGGNGCGAWSPDGRTLTVPAGDGDKMQQYAFDAAVPALRPTRMLENTANGGPSIVYNPAGDRFVSRGWNLKVALFDAVSGRVLFTTHSLPPASHYTLRFDRTGKRLAGARTGDRKERIGLWSVADGREYRALVHTGSGEVYSHPAIHPGGRLAAMGLTDGVTLSDLETGGELAYLSVQRGSRVAFDGAGNLLTNGFNGAFRWPVRPEATNPGRLLIGPPQRLPFHPGQNNIAASRDGQVIAQCMFNGYGEQDYAGGWILHPNSPLPRRVDARLGMDWTSVSPDGRWVAFGQHMTRVNVFDAATGQRVWQSPAEHGDYCRFSPDGRWLVTDVDGGQVYAVGSWEPGPLLGPGRPWDVTSELAVLGQLNGIYRLVELSTGRELARLEDPEQNAGHAAFTPDGTKLVALAKNGLRVWDLRRIREELSKLGLDWEAPPYPAFEEGTSSKPLQVEVDRGELIAREKYSLVLAFFPFHAEGYYRRGLAYVRSGQGQEAFDDFSRALTLKPDHAEAHYQRGLFYAARRKAPEALTDFTAAITRNPEHARAYAERGHIYFGRNDWSKAAADYSQAIARQAGDALVWHRRAHAYENLDDYARAFADFSKAIELSPQEAGFWYCRGKAYARQAAWQNALTDFSKVINLHQDWPEPWKDRADAYAHLGQRDESAADYERFFNFRPGDAKAYNDFAWSLATGTDLQLRNPDYAVQLAEKAVKLAPNDGNCWNTLGVAHYRAGHWKDAIEGLTKSMELQKGAMESFDTLFLAMARWHLGEKEKARQWYQRAVQWMDKNKRALEKDKPHQEELRRFRAEAAELLGIQAKTTHHEAKKDATEKP